MEKVRFGRTELRVSRTSFGAIPIQRLSDGDSTKLLRRAYETGINLFDTARGYTTSEGKIGLALSDVRGEIILATKTPSRTPEGIRKDLETSLSMLKTDYIDLYQFHNPPFVPVPGDELFETMRALQREGKIRHIGITNHDLALAKQAVASGHYDSLQFPLSLLSSPEELELAALCREADMGLLAMKALSGGLITSAAAAFAFLWQYGNIVPIWGMQHEWELEEFIALSALPPTMTEEIQSQIDRDRKELGGSFCRGCGYCLPCPAEIPIPTAARISLLLRRADPKQFTTPKIQGEMQRIRDCQDCGHCKAHCPYGLDTPALLRSELDRYEDFMAHTALDI